MAPTAPAQGGYPTSLDRWEAIKTISQYLHLVKVHKQFNPNKMVVLLVSSAFAHGDGIAPV